MSNSSLDRFEKRKRLKKSHTVYADFDESLKNQFLNSPINEQKVNEVYDKTSNMYNISVSEEEVKEFYDKFKKEFDDKKFDNLIADCRKEVISSIVTPFGLGKIVATLDKTGGNVTTIHNASQKIYANETEQYNRDDYARAKNSEGKKFSGGGKNSVGSNFTKSQMDKNGNVIDAYTGKTQKADTTSPDHIMSLSQYHKNGGFMQSQTQRADFGTDEDNLALTDRSINQSMRDDNKEEWSKKTKNGQTNQKRYDIDESKLEEQIKKGEETAKKHLPTNLKKAQYYSKNAVKTGLLEGCKMGAQQAIGLVITEFFTAVFDELIDVYTNGYYQEFDDKFLSVLKQRLTRVAKRLQAKWKDVAVALKDGFISGFISNLVTTVINMFVTTAKRVVRIIREGLFSLFKAVKLLLFPPADMTLDQRMHEAKKLIATGLIVSLGVVAEEYVEKLIASTGTLAPFAEPITAVFVGAITGLSITMVVYYLDKKKDDKDFISNLLLETEERHININKMLSFG